MLDIGCNSGLYSFAAKLRGARSVLGIDYFQHCVDQALLMREVLQLDVDFRQGDGEALSEGVKPSTSFSTPASSIIFRTRCSSW